jgi:Lrp/AsnC family transcriptional regulator, regulator for asnA, asnC and gidA
LQKNQIGYAVLAVERMVKLGKLDKIDMHIVRCLNQDARTPMVAIAKQINIPHSTVRHRLNRLIQDGIIEFAVLANPYQFSPLCAHFEFHVETAKVRDVAAAIAKSKNIYFVAVTLGSYELMATGFFQSQEQLLKFTSEWLSSISGIVSVRTHLVADVVKRVLTFDLQDDGIVTQPHGRRRVTNKRVRRAPEK